MGQKTLERLERLRKLNSNRQWVNHELYRLMYKEDLYIVAYERIKSKPGNMTPGTDGETLDGFSLETIREIIQEMRTEIFQFKPARTTFIPKGECKIKWLFRTLRAISSSLQNLLPQEWEPASAIQGTLNVLQLVDFSLNRSMTVGESEGRVKSRTFLL